MPPSTVRTFRIFVSSTFSDLKAERNALQERVFPRLKELAAAHGCRFQAIDLRWGVSSEAALDQQTMKICLGEVERCQKISPRPNFIVLLGDRYGWCPLPYEIPADEYDRVAARLQGADRSLLEQWYPRDDNAVPAVHVLQPRQGGYEDDDAWGKDEAALRTALNSAVQGLDLPVDSLVKYTASATEQEIVQGALKVPDASEHVFCYLRTLEGLPAAGQAGPFAEADMDAVRRLADLKSRLTQHLANNVRAYTARWQDHGPSLAHIDALCEDVYHDLSKVILQEIGLIRQVDPLEAEISAHAAFAQDRARGFRGRADALTSIKAYADSSDPHVLALWGPSGIGKTALMAQAIRENGHEPIYRFIGGANPESSNARALLDGMCRQIARRYGADESDIPAEFQELALEFAKRLALATPDKPLTIFLDALDQLSDADNARNLSWLPSQLPANVRIVVSTLPGECLQVLEARLPVANRLEVKPLTAADAEAILRAWLDGVHRKLQPDQKTAILSKFRECGLALYLRLAFEEAKLWRSYDPLPALSADLPGIFRDLFRRLSEPSNHGSVLVSHSLGCLASARKGLSEDELLDVLSRDEEAMTDFRRRSPKSPKMDRLPVVIWSRLYFDLEPYLTERTADGAALLTFYHQQMAEAVNTFLLEGDEKAGFHRALGAYFRMAADPAVDGSWRNGSLHALVELPYQLQRGGAASRVECTSLLCDILYLNARATRAGIWELLDDFPESPSSTAEYRAFLLKHAGALSHQDGQLIALLHHEGPAAMRANVELAQQNGLYTTAWLRTQKLERAAPDASDARTSTLQTISSLEFNLSYVVGLAPAAHLAFHIVRLGTLGIVDAARSRALDQVIPIRNSRPLGLFPSEDGCYLAVAYDDGQAEVLQLEWGSAGLLKSAPVAAVDYLLPEFDAPAMAWDDHVLIFQDESGQVLRFDPVTSSRTSVPLGPNAAHRELRCVRAWNHDLILALSADGGTQLMLAHADSADSICRLDNADATFICAGGGSVFAASFSNREVRVFDAAAQVSELARAATEYLPLCMAFAGDSLVIVTDMGYTCTWSYARGNPLVQLEARRASAVSQYPRWVAPLEDGRFIAVSQSTAEVLRIESAAGPIGQQVLAALNAAGRPHAVIKRAGMLLLVDLASQHETPLADDAPRLRHFAADGSGLFLYACTDGSGLLVDCAARSTQPVTSVPITMAALTGDPHGGFWIADRLGSIYHFDRAGSLQPVWSTDAEGARVQELLCSDARLVWRGWTSDPGPSDEGHVDTVIFFDIGPANQLSELGRRCFHKQEGFIEAIASEADRDRWVVVLGNSSQERRVIRQGSAGQFISGQELHHSVGWLRPVVRSANCTGINMLYLLCEDGSVACVDSTTGLRQAALSPSAPFRLQAAGTSGSDVLLVDAAASAYLCRKENG